MRLSQPRKEPGQGYSKAAGMTSAKALGVGKAWQKLGTGIRSGLLEYNEHGRVWQQVGTGKKARHRSCWGVQTIVKSLDFTQRDWGVVAS